VQRNSAALRRRAQLEVEILELRDCPSVSLTNPGNKVNYDGERPIL